MDENDKINGAEIAAQILKRLEPEHRERLVEAIEEKAPEIATEIVFAMAHAETQGPVKPKRLADQIEIERADSISELLARQEEEIALASGSYQDEKLARPDQKGLKRRIA